MKKVISTLLLLAMLCALVAGASFAAADDYTLNDAAVSVDGVSDGTADVVFASVAGGNFYGLEGYWSTKETEESSFLKLTALTPAGAITPMENYPSNGHVYWSDMSFTTPITAAAGGAIWTATYTVDKDTPSGVYTVSFDISVVSPTSGEDTSVGTLTATVTVTNTTEPVPSTGAKLNKDSVTIGVDKTAQLNASLLPANTTETISSVTWESGDAAIATVSETGLVTGVAGGSTTVTATVQTKQDDENKSEWTVSIPVTVTTSPYTFSIARSGSGKVYAGDTVTMQVSVTGDSFNAWEATIQYDTAVFTCAEDPTSTGSIYFYDVSADTKASASVVKELTFTAKTLDATTDGQFSVLSACADKYGDAAKLADAPAAAVAEPVTVTVTKQYPVKFFERNGSSLITSMLVDDGETVTGTEPTAAAVTNYEFKGWIIGSDTENVKTWADITSTTSPIPVTADVSYTAYYEALTGLTVTLGDGLDYGDPEVTTGTYGEDFEVEIDPFDPTNYDYVVTYTVGGETYIAAPSEDGSPIYVLRGDKMTGPVTVELTKTLKNFNIELKPNYVSGWYELVVSNASANPSVIYAYNGDAMYYVAPMEGSGYGYYAWLIKADALTGETDAEKLAYAKSKVTLADAAAGTIAAGYSVNEDATVGLTDVMLAFGCYNKATGASVFAVGSPDENMALYLRADVNRDYKVNVTDVQLILNAYNG